MTLARTAQDLFVALRFYSRIPTPEGGTGASEAPHGPPDLDRIAYAVPLAGALLGLIAALVLVLADLARFPAFLSVTLALTILVIATGALAEDALADTADGFGGGRDRAQRLAIMRDSRIGSFGAAALMLSLLLRLGALMALVEAAGVLRTGLVLIAAAAAARATGILMLAALPSARADGASAAFGRPSPDAALACALMAALVVAVILVPSFGIGATFAGLIAPVLTLYAMIALARRLIGGQTGDVAGATQQIAEIVFLLAVLIFARAP